jgi:muramoyltetrapeptide carboxypeptidase
MLTPPSLRQGDTVGLVAPGYCIGKEQWAPVIPLLHSWGVSVETGKSLQLRKGVFAGSDAERLEDLAGMMRNPRIKAVFCARGGYGCNRLLPGFKNYSSAYQCKWLVGYSDITALAACTVDSLQWQCIHGPMPIDCPGTPNENHRQSWDFLRRILFGEIPEYHIPVHSLNRNGNANAVLVGGNLSVLYGLSITPDRLNTDNRILFIEEVGESLHHLDRMMYSLRAGGRLEKLKGLIAGSMTQMKDSNPPFGKTADEIIREHVAGYDYPVVFAFPAGHGDVHYPLVLGAETSLSVSSRSVIIRQSFSG